MSLEIEQPPHLTRPDLKNPLTWAIAGPLHSDWLRHISPQLGLDTNKLLLGNVLASIIGDDENSFGYKNIYLPHRTEYAKASLYIRMDWEKNLPELPEIIRGQIERIKERLSGVSWEGRKNFNAARRIWTKEIRNFTQYQVKVYNNLQDAIQYQHEVTPLWVKYWNEFLHGHKLFGE